MSTNAAVLLGCKSSDGTGRCTRREMKQQEPQSFRTWSLADVGEKDAACVGFGDPGVACPLSTSGLCT